MIVVALIAGALLIIAPHWMPSVRLPSAVRFSEVTSLDCRRALLGSSPPVVSQLKPNELTSRVILLAPHSSELPTLAEVAHWLRPGWYTLLVEDAAHLWGDEYAAALLAMSTRKGLAAAVSNRRGHKHAPAALGILRAPNATACRARSLGGAHAGALFAQVRGIHAYHRSSGASEECFPILLPFGNPTRPMTLRLSSSCGTSADGASRMTSRAISSPCSASPSSILPQRGRQHSLRERARPRNCCSRCGRGHAIALMQADIVPAFCSTSSAMRERVVPSSPGRRTRCASARSPPGR